MMSTNPIDAITVANTGNREKADLDQLKEATGQAVGSVFFGTLLQTMRESPLRGRYGHGGRGEEVFAGQLDGLLAERAGAASTRGLGELLYRHLESQQRRVSEAAAKSSQGAERT